jgi:NAD dependent epimerase/dehydratase family enzyme
MKKNVLITGGTGLWVSILPIYYYKTDSVSILSRRKKKAIQTQFFITLGM